MDELVRAGKVRHVAASNFASWQICRMLWLAETRKLPRVSVTQPMFNLLARGIEQEFLPMCQQLGVPRSSIIPWPADYSLGNRNSKRRCP